MFNYPVQNAHLDWDAALGKGFTLRNRLQVAERYQQTPYPVWGLSISHDVGTGNWAKFRPYLRLANLSNTGYQEIQNVAMPGRSISGGISVRLPE